MDIVVVKCPKTLVDELRDVRDFVMESLEKGVLVLGPGYGYSVETLPDRVLVEQQGPEPVVLRGKEVPQVSIQPKPQCKKAPPAQRKREILERLKAYREKNGQGCFASLEDKAGINASLLRGLLTGETKADIATWDAVDKALDKLEKAHG